MLEEEVVHLPEAALGGGASDCLRCQLGARVDVGQGQVAEDVAQVVAEALA